LARCIVWDLSQNNNSFQPILEIFISQTLVDKRPPVFFIVTSEACGCFEPYIDVLIAFIDLINERLGNAL
jgi:hypothetical protein